MEKIYSVSEIISELQGVLADHFPHSLWVTGEISNFSKSQAGHIYFTLKDESSVLRCAMFRGANQYLKFQPQNGQQVQCRGRIAIYEARGECQLVVEFLEPSGQGALQLAFEQLKEKLRKEGLFEPSRKRAIPFLPERIAVVSSPTGAVIHDIMTVLGRRCPQIQLVLYPIKVQGEGAAESIEDAFHQINSYGGFDVVILARGGGSLEDLWPFNEEKVARSIAGSKVPVISGVGHEVDFTVADFVADLRAPTPSAAAELAAPDRGELLRQLGYYREKMAQNLLSSLQQARERFSFLKQNRKLKSPLAIFEGFIQRLDHYSEDLKYSFLQRLTDSRNRYKELARALQAVSPLAVLDRGYSITLKLPERQVVTDASLLKEGDLLESKVARGLLISRLEKKGREKG